MEHIDITFDLETLATVPTAAVMSIAAVAWNRYTPFEKLDGYVLKHAPFLFDRRNLRDDEMDSLDNMMKYKVGIDLRDCLKHGLTFDSKTIEWWNSQSKEAKESITEDKAETLYEALDEFFCWIRFVKKTVDAGSVCLWCQGSDFDIAILRNLCYVLGFDLNHEFEFHNFRDCRTVICENQAMIDEIEAHIFGYDVKIRNAVMVNNTAAYTNIELYEQPDYMMNGIPHDPLYDCMRSTWNTWISMCNVMRLVDEVHELEYNKDDE